MNASQIITEEMTLEEKLAAIDLAMASTQAEFRKANPSAGPIDPADLTMCEGCQ